MKPALIFAALLALAGCAGTPTAYDLGAARPGRAVLRGTLIVETPRAEPPLDGDLIVVRNGDAVERLGGAQWADSLPRLARSRIVETLQNAGLTANLREEGQPASARLRVDIRRFDIK